MEKIPLQPRVLEAKAAVELLTGLGVGRWAGSVCRGIGIRRMIVIITIASAIANSCVVVPVTMIRRFDSISVMVLMIIMTKTKLLLLLLPPKILTVY